MKEEGRTIAAAVLVALGFWTRTGLGANTNEARVHVDAAHIVQTEINSFLWWDLRNGQNRNSNNRSARGGNLAQKWSNL